jgi:hypothetical protein
LKKYVLAFGLLTAILIVALLTGCDCSNSNINPDNYGNYGNGDQNTTTSTTAVGSVAP